MKTLKEMGVVAEDWRISNAAREEMGVEAYGHYGEEFLHRTIDRGKYRSDLPISPDEEEGVAMLKAYGRKLGFDYVPRQPFI